MERNLTNEAVIDEVKQEKFTGDVSFMPRTCDMKEIVVIKWLDAHEKEQQWDSMEETLKWAEKENWLVTQVGFIIFENDEYILLSSQMTKPDENHLQRVGNATKIPKGWIVARLNMILEWTGVK